MGCGEGSQGRVAAATCAAARAAAALYLPLLSSTSWVSRCGSEEKGRTARGRRLPAGAPCQQGAEGREGRSRKGAGAGEEHSQPWQSRREDLEVPMHGIIS